MNERTYKAFAEKIGEVNRANGWDVPNYGTIPAKVMMVVTELDEARDAAREIGDDTLAVELADIAIRILDILESVWPSDWSFRSAVVGRRPWNSIEELLWPTLKRLCDSVEHWRRGEEASVLCSLELALKEVCHLAYTLGVRIEIEIEDKIKVNEVRGHLHGKVSSV